MVSEGCVRQPSAVRWAQTSASTGFSFNGFPCRRIRIRVETYGFGWYPSLRAIAWMRPRVSAEIRGLFARLIDTVACVTPACVAMVFMVMPLLICLRIGVIQGL